MDVADRGCDPGGCGEGPSELGEGEETGLKGRHGDDCDDDDGGGSGSGCWW